MFTAFDMGGSEAKESLEELIHLLHGLSGNFQKRMSDNYGIQSGNVEKMASSFRNGRKAALDYASANKTAERTQK